MMGRIFAQQYQVVKDFKKSLDRLNGNYETEKAETRTVESESLRVPADTLFRAQELLDHILERRKEIMDLEEEAKRTNQQVGLLMLLNWPASQWLQRLLTSGYSSTISLASSNNKPVSSKHVLHSSAQTKATSKDAQLCCSPL